jgi:hypothetical protein
MLVGRGLGPCGTSDVVGPWGEHPWSMDDERDRTWLRRHEVQPRGAMR